MNRFSVFRAIAVVAAITAASSASADSSGKWQSSQEVYDKVCSYCHEADVGPVIRGRNLLPGYIKTVVRHGNRAMPAFRETEISDAMLADVVKLVATGPAVTRK
jgi:mono/diheme cytochrome c family protein